MIGTLCNHTNIYQLLVIICLVQINSYYIKLAQALLNTQVSLEEHIIWKKRLDLWNVYKKTSLKAPNLAPFSSSTPPSVHYYELPTTGADNQTCRRIHTRPTIYSLITNNAQRSYEYNASNHNCSIIWSKSPILQQTI